MEYKGFKIKIEIADENDFIKKYVFTICLEDESLAGDEIEYFFKRKAYNAAKKMIDSESFQKFFGRDA